MPQYEASRFAPPAPVALVSFHDAASGKSVSDVEMLIDSGADVTVVPGRILDQLGVSVTPGVHFEVAAFHGGRALAEVAALEMHWMSRVFRGQFLVAALDHGILGRNVLNSVGLLLDGPRLTWEVAASKVG